MTYKEIYSPIENTILKQVLEGNEIVVLRLEPITAEYKVHDKERDFIKIDPETKEELIELGFIQQSTTVDKDYDFNINPRKFYAVKIEQPIPPTLI